MRSVASSRAAQAAARVAARYAQTPSYSEMQAAEARVAVRAAEIATQVALEAQATAEAVLATMDAAFEAPVLAPALVQSPETVLPPLPEPAWEPIPGPVQQETLPAATADATFGLRWEPDLPARRTELGVSRATHGRDAFEIPTEDWWQPAEPEQASAPSYEAIEPAQTIPANLIEFPSELVATRKVRPRRAEGEFAASAGVDSQLSIFEVDPITISIEPEPAHVATATAAEWPGMQLEENTLLDETLADVEPVRFASALQLAPLNRRVMATVVDGTLITGLFLATVLVAGSHVNGLPPVKQIEVGVALGWSAIAALYQFFFYAVAKATPGMKYAGISLCTFDDQFPSHARVFGRLAALLFSLVPLGLGVVWALFDEEHLGWHDRISKTYQRKS